MIDGVDGMDVVCKNDVMDVTLIMVIVCVLM